ncbi:MAG: twin-arginine translocation pathway signal protein [Thermoplasmatota archaeon]
MRTLAAVLAFLLAGCTTAPDGATTDGAGTTTTGPPVECTASPAQTEGPYFLDGRADRADIRSDGSGSALPDGYDEYVEAPERIDLRASGGSAQAGAAVQLTLKVSLAVDGKCAPLQGAQVDLWHANATGVYSGFGTGVGHDFLRGRQTTAPDGTVTFITIWPGWYPGRAVHMHVKVRSFAAGSASTEYTSQLYFQDTQNALVLAAPPYSSHPGAMRNADDAIYRSGGPSLLVAAQPSGQAWAASKELVVA